MDSKLKEKAWKKEFERPIYEEWKKEKIYSFNPDSEKPFYSIDTPPPYVNAPVHMGHETTYILMDMFARFWRMSGHEVLFPLGLDRNGLPIEVATEKKFKIAMNDVSRESFIKLCKQLLEEFSLKSTETFFRSGISFSSWKIGNMPGDIYLTDSDEYRKLTQSTFIDLWNNGLIYVDKRINNWCPGCQTTVADNEIEYKDVSSKFNDVAFTVKETGEKIIIGTTRPELICTCGIIFFNPADKRYVHLEGKTAVTPVYGKEVPIKSSNMADLNFGTGLLMVCSAGDLNDIRVFRELGMKPVIAINQDGRMNEHAGLLKGLKVREARQKIIEELKSNGLLIKSIDMKHRTPICERSKHEIEFIEMEEYYVKQMDFLKDVKTVSDKINFYSKKNKQILLDWMSSVSIDWPVSRRRYYATEIPLWHCKCGEVIVPPKGKYYKPWKENPPIKCKCGGNEFEGESRVFDTWFDSSISPLYILKYLEEPEFFKKAFPASLRPQGKEIVRTWLYYTLLRCYQLTDKPVFRDVWIHYHVLDGKGKKMSKSAGNTIDPSKLLDQYGAEPIRLWTVLEGNLTDGDFRCSEDRIQGGGKFLTKIWNVAKFISIFNESGKGELQPLDLWILSELDKLVKEAQNYAKYDFHNPVTKIRHFVWETFASHYLELVKSRAYNENGKFTEQEQKAAVWTLNHVLDICLKLLAPVAPFITYKIYKDLREKNVHLENFPKEEGNEFKEFTTEELVEFNSNVWKLKREKGVSLKDPVSGIEIPEKLKCVEKELKEAHKI